MGFAVTDPVTQTGMRVNDKRRAAVDSISISESDEAAVKGWKFNINTGDITLTSAAKTSVLYIKNDFQYDLVVDQFIYNLGNTTGGSGDIKVEVLRNPKVGDIITNANDVLVGTGVEANENFSSTNVLVGDFFKGATGETALSSSDGVVLSTRVEKPTGRIFIDGAEMVLPRGSSLGIDYTPPSGNTSQIVEFAMACHVRHPDFVDVTI